MSNPRHIDWAEDIRNIIAPAVTFAGIYDSHINYNYGDVCLIGESLYIFDGKRDWTELGICSERTNSAPKMKFITNCPNCGAPMQNHRCVYCGTEDYGS